MDLGTLIGLGIGFGVLGLGVITAGVGLGSLFDVPSLLITVGGGIAGTIIANPWETTLGMGKVSRSNFSMFKDLSVFFQINLICKVLLQP